MRRDKRWRAHRAVLALGSLLAGLLAGCGGSDVHTPGGIVRLVVEPETVTFVGGEHTVTATVDDSSVTAVSGLIRSGDWSQPLTIQSLGAGTYRSSFTLSPNVTPQSRQYTVEVTAQGRGGPWQQTATFTQPGIETPGGGTEVPVPF